jgi:hypothetical protein
MLGPGYQGLVKQRIVAEKGSNDDGWPRANRPRLSSHGSYERVHCDGVGIVV